MAYDRPLVLILGWDFRRASHETSLPSHYCHSLVDSTGVGADEIGEMVEAEVVVQSYGAQGSRCDLVGHRVAEVGADYGAAMAVGVLADQDRVVEARTLKNVSSLERANILGA